VDPHAVLGLEPGATPEEVQRAYRVLAKRFHPDRAGEGAGELMTSINAAYDLLRELDDRGRAPAGAGSPRPRPARTATVGAWLPPAVRRVLARELLVALEPGELVDEIALTSTGDSHDVQLVVTDRRLLWLRDDAITGRVRSLRHREIARVERRHAGRLFGGPQLRVRAADGRRIGFFDLRPEVLGRLVAAISARATA
jgi:hypothetical protein